MQPASINSAMCGLCILVKYINILNKLLLLLLLLLLLYCCRVLNCFVRGQIQGALLNLFYITVYVYLKS